MLQARLPVFQGFDVAAAVQAFHLDLVDIADREVTVQGLAEKQRMGAVIVAGQAQMQALVEADQQAQFHGVGPVGQRLHTAVEDEFDADRIVLFANVFQPPVEGAHQAVGRRGAAAILRLDLGGVAFQRAEPWPAHRDPAAQALAAPVFRLLAEPDQRRRVIALVAEQLRALLGDQQLRALVADSPAGQLADLLVFDLCGHGRFSGGWGGKGWFHKAKRPSRTGVLYGAGAAYGPYTVSGSQVISCGQR